MKKKTMRPRSARPRAGAIPHVQPVQTTSRPVHAETSYRELKGKPFKV